MFMDERELVEVITREVLKQLQSTEVNLTPQRPSPRPLVIVDGFFGEYSRLRSILEVLNTIELRFWLFLGKTDLNDRDLSEKLKRCLINPQVLEHGEVNLSEKELENILSKSSSLVLPWLPLATLSGIVSLQPQDPVSLLLIKGLLLKKEVLIRKVFVQPMLDLYQDFQLSPLMRRVQGLITEGKLLGISWLADGDLWNLFNQISESTMKLVVNGLLTAEDVRSMKDQGEIIVPMGTVITPLAQDELKRYKLKLRMN